MGAFTAPVCPVEWELSQETVYLELLSLDAEVASGCFCVGLHFTGN